MNPSVAPPGPPVNFLNVGYFFQLVYNFFVTFHLIPGASSSGTGFLSSLNDFFSIIWLLITLLAYIFCLACIGFLVYYSTRLYQIAEEEEPKYSTLPKEVADTKLEHSRWEYIRQLIESPHESDWRQAVIEADIMLDEMLSKIGLEGDNVAEKLKAANIDRFHTLQDAWEAHKVRNDIAHQGSAYKLTDQIAYRTIGRYENVFREFNEI
jgi:hypothetical protein